MNWDTIIAALVAPALLAILLNWQRGREEARKALRDQAAEKRKIKAEREAEERKNARDDLLRQREHDERVQVAAQVAGVATKAEEVVVRVADVASKAEAVATQVAGVKEQLQTSTSNTEGRLLALQQVADATHMLTNSA